MNSHQAMHKMPIVEPATGWRKDWEYGQAKTILARLIKDGKVTLSDMPASVQRMHPLFLLYKAENFSSNYRALQKKSIKDKSDVDRDKKAMTDDRRLFPAQPINSVGMQRFHGSEAERLMIELLENPEYTKYCDAPKKGKEKIAMPRSVRKELYLENEAVNKHVGGFDRWSQLLTSKLEGSKNRLIQMKLLQEKAAKKAKKYQIN